MPTVLVVDDEHEIMSAIQSILEDEGYRVLVARDGAGALEVLGKVEPPDAVLSDVMMPRMSGHDLLQRMRANDRLAKVPVALMSSVSPPSRASGAWNAFLRKPFTMDDLLRTVATLVKK